MNRRKFIAALMAGGVMTAEGLWMPGQKLISIPSGKTFFPNSQLIRETGLEAGSGVYIYAVLADGGYQLIHSSTVEDAPQTIFTRTYQTNKQLKYRVQKPHEPHLRPFRSAA